jgi:hypothetical protein
MAGKFPIGGACLTAKHKLNAAHVNGALMIAAVLGVLTQSWLVFLIAAAVLIATSIQDGSIRK